MADSREQLYEAVLTQGDVSPKSIESMVNVLLLGGLEKAIEAPSAIKHKSKKGAHSKQLRGDPFESLAAGEYVEPRYNPDIWAAAMENNTRLGRSVRTYARNTVGLGWFVEPLEKISPKTPEELKKKIARQKKIIEDILSHPNNDMPLNELFYVIKIDEEATGNGYLEVVRNNAGEITELHHAPGVTMRIRVREDDKGRQYIGGFVQIRGNEKIYFREFGDVGVMDSETGEYHEGPEPLPLDKRASEIIHFRLYSPTSTWYGAPRYVSTSPAITGNRLASLRNMKFFENDAVPRLAITVSGGTLTPDSVQAIEEFFKAKSMGVDKAHNCMVIQAEQQKTGFQNQSQQAQITLQPLTVGVTEDSSFSNYRKENDEEVREAFGISQVFYASESSNRASAQVGREITNEQEFEPDRLEKEYIINQKLIRDILQDEEEVLVRFRFERMKLTDPMDTARIDQTYAGMGALTPNELRVSIGKAPYPPEYEFADKPMQIAMAEMSMKLAESITGSWDKMLALAKKEAKQQQEVQQEGQKQQQGGQQNQQNDAAGENPLAQLLGNLDNKPENFDDVSTDESTAFDPRGHLDSFRDESSDGVDEIQINKAGDKISAEFAMAIARELMSDARTLKFPVLEEAR
ncbi:MAG TPA: phage portal protein [Desulfosporosinus sp.]|nr:phage portal protein [Desulfosporosinus sp.]